MQHVTRRKPKRQAWPRVDRYRKRRVTCPNDLHAARLFDLLSAVDDPRRDVLLSVYRDHEDLFHASPGSRAIHQAWPGGLADHLADMLRLSWLEYGLLATFLSPRRERLPFSLASAQVAIFVHDAEKVVLYADPADPRCRPFALAGPADKAAKETTKWKVIESWRERYGLHLTDEEVNAVRYAHGEGDDYRNDRRVMNEMAAFVGNLDRVSARILYASGRDAG